MAVNRKHHAVDTAPPERWALLGNLLRARRIELGYVYRPAFAETRLPKTAKGNPNVRMLNAVENNERPGTYAPGRLEQFAKAYEVTLESVLAVLGGTAETLEPATPAAVTQLPPMAEAARIAADRRYYTQIAKRLRQLAARGITDPTGAQVFGEGTQDARTWDRIDATVWDLDDRAWIIADLQRWEGRNGGGSGSPEVTSR